MTTLRPVLQHPMPRPTTAFLDELRERARIYGWIGDYVEVSRFVEALYEEAGVLVGEEDLEPYATVAADAEGDPRPGDVWRMGGMPADGGARTYRVDRLIRQSLVRGTDHVHETDRVVFAVLVNVDTGSTRTEEPAAMTTRNGWRLISRDGTVMP